MAASLTTDVITATSLGTSTGQAVAPGPVVRSGETTKQDSVKLSPTAQALQLYQQGENGQYIAATLGLPVATVDSYLSIQVPASTSAATASATAAVASVKG